MLDLRGRGEERMRRREEPEEPEGSREDLRRRAGEVEPARSRPWRSAAATATRRDESETARARASEIGD
jgi:hypothetical protein